MAGPTDPPPRDRRTGGMSWDSNGLIVHDRSTLSPGVNTGETADFLAMGREESGQRTGWGGWD